MTKEELVSMARESGFLIDYYAQQYQPNCILSTHGLIDENLQRFANLVAAHKAEPPEWLLVKNILDEYGLDAIAFVAEWKAAQQQAEPVAFYDFNKGFYWAKPTKIVAPTVVDVPPMPLYTSLPQRPWVGLTPEEILDLFDVNNVYGSKWIEFARTVEQALKAKNT